MSLIVERALSRHADAPAALACWFQAPTAFGPILLRAAAPAHHAAEAALLLDRCDALLTALEDWTGQALPWRWTAPPAASVLAAAPAHARCEGDLQLQAPWAWLRALPPPPDALAARLRWAPVPVVLSIAQLRLAPDELLLLEPGGAVILPESLQPGWQGRLCAADESTNAGAGVPVALASPLLPRLRRGAIDDSAPLYGEPGAVAFEVRLDLPHGLAADRLTGWHEATLPVPDSLGASLWRSAARPEPAHRLAHGTLMPWGDGWALLIDALGENTVTFLDAEATVKLPKA